MKKEEIYKLEELTDWDDVISAWKSLYEKDNDDFEIYSRYLFAIIFGLNEPVTRILDWKKDKNKIIDLFFIGKEKWDTAEFNWTIGYFINYSPEYFSETETYSKWENLGKEMMDRAYKLDSNNNIFKMTYLLNHYSSKETIHNRKFFELSLIVLEEADVKYKGSGIFNEFFRDQLSIARRIKKL